MPNLPEKIATLRQRAESAGRDPNTISISIFGANPDKATLEQLEVLGVERAIFFVPPAERDVVMPLVDKYSGFVGG
jgi:hypothetical protein